MNAAPAIARERFDRLDALRAAAILWMGMFHLFFDLAHFRFIRANFYTDPFWTTQRTAILSLFLLCAGAGQAIAWEQRQPWSRFWRRWAQVAGCAVLVSLGSWVMFRHRYISFGVLHAIAVMMIVMRLSVRWGGWLWLAGAVAIVLPQLIRDPFFDTRLTNWVGMTTRKPATEDYVPLLPWIGVMWWGVAGGQWVLRRHRHWLSGGVAPVLQPMATLGRWSLTFYMLHQPVLIGILMLVMASRGR